MASIICSNCGEIVRTHNPDIRGHDYPCSFNLRHRRQKDGIVVVIAKGNVFDCIETKY